MWSYLPRALTDLMVLEDCVDVVRRYTWSSWFLVLHEKQDGDGFGTALVLLLEPGEAPIRLPLSLTDVVERIMPSVVRGTMPWSSTGGSSTPWPMRWIAAATCSLHHLVRDDAALVGVEQVLFGLDRARPPAFRRTP